MQDPPPASASASDRRSSLAAGRSTYHPPGARSTTRPPRTWEHEGMRAWRNRLSESPFRPSTRPRERCVAAAMGFSPHPPITDSRPPPRPPTDHPREFAVPALRTRVPQHIPKRGTPSCGPLNHVKCLSAGPERGTAGLRPLAREVGSRRPKAVCKPRCRRHRPSSQALVERVTGLVIRLAHPLRSTLRCMRVTRLTAPNGDGTYIENWTHQPISSFPSPSGLAFFFA